MPLGVAMDWAICYCVPSFLLEVWGKTLKGPERDGMLFQIGLNSCLWPDHLLSKRLRGKLTCLWALAELIARQESYFHHWGTWLYIDHLFTQNRLNCALVAPNVSPLFSFSTPYHLNLSVILDAHPSTCKISLSLNGRILKFYLNTFCGVTWCYKGYM